MDINEAVLSEFDKYQKFVEKNPADGARYKTDKVEPYVNGTLDDGQILRLRMDYEEDGKVTGAPKDTLYDIMNVDILDLLENGDISLTHDPLLKVCDGWKKRDKKPVAVELAEAVMQREYVSRKDTTVFTVYILFWVQWD